MYNIVITLPIFLLPAFLISTKLYMCIWLNTKKKKKKIEREKRNIHRLTENKSQTPEVKPRLPKISKMES